jgi:hypothetical protein
MLFTGKKIPRGSSHIKTVEPVSSSIISRKTVTNKSIWLVLSTFLKINYFSGHSHSRPFIKPFLASSNHSQHQKADISTSMEIPEEHKKMFEEARKIVQKVRDIRYNLVSIIYELIQD